MALPDALEVTLTSRLVVSGTLNIRQTLATIVPSTTSTSSAVKDITGIPEEEKSAHE